MATEQLIPPTPAKKPISEAKRAANRRNAQSSRGPGAEGRKRSRFNAVKHGLSSQIAWLNKVSPEDRESLQLALLRLNPRNAIEKLHVDNLLTTRLLERLSLETERLVLTRQPVSMTGSDERPFPFLRDPTALNTFQQLTRHVAHLSHTTEKEILALLRARQDRWVAPKTNSAEDLGPNPNNSQAGAPTGTAPTNEGAAIADQPEPGSLEACLRDKRVLLPGEDAQAYETFARELWSDFGPSNLLEAFLVQDAIETQWRLIRIRNLHHLVLEQGSRSFTHQECGLPFGFLQDSQGLGVLQILQQYEKILHRRLEKRMALLRRVRKEGWTDSPVSNAAVPTIAASGDQPRPLETQAVQPLPDAAQPVATPTQPCGTPPASFDERFSPLPAPPLGFKDPDSKAKGPDCTAVLPPGCYPNSGRNQMVPESAPARWLRRVADYWSSRWRS